jgi:hypothetical protein
MEIVTESDHESHTAPMSMGQQAKHFLQAARKIGDGLPATFLGCHGMELALKSHLRARGMKIEELKGIQWRTIASPRGDVTDGYDDRKAEDRSAGQGRR